MKINQILLFVALGILFWLCAALLIRYVGASVFTEGNPYLIVFYLLVMPITGLFLLVTRLATGLGYTEMLKPVVVITLTATFLDGIALSWFRSLYSASFEVALHGAAWILWGVGMGLLFALVLDARGNQQPIPVR